MKTPALLLVFAMAACGGSKPAAAPPPPPVQTAGLQLRIVNGQVPFAQCLPPAGINPPDAETAVLPGKKTCYDLGPALMTVGRVATADVEVRGKAVAVAVSLPLDISEQFAAVSADNLKKTVAGVLDGDVIVAAPVQAVLDTSYFSITGGYSPAEAELIAARLRSLG